MTRLIHLSTPRFLILSLSLTLAPVSRFPLSEMRYLDLLFRQKIELLLEIKVRRVPFPSLSPPLALTQLPLLSQNASSFHLINTLHLISDLQSTIAHLPPILSNVETETDPLSPPAFNHLFSI